MFSPFTESAPAKINLALHVLGRRHDGYHELDSIVAFADIADTLLFEPAAEMGLAVTGPFAEGLTTGPDNLVMKAIDALSEHAKLPPMRITLTKNLPVSAGLGGGSADAAAALRGSMHVHGTPMSPEKLRAIALMIGADVPVCLLSHASHMQGVGDQISKATAPASAIVLANPLVPCRTETVFAALGLKAGETYRDRLELATPKSWRNDLTSAAMTTQPAIREVLGVLAARPQFTAVRMSGSGATCFGLVADMEAAAVAAAELAQAHPQWWVRAAALS